MPAFDDIFRRKLPKNRLLQALTGPDSRALRQAVCYDVATAGLMEVAMPRATRMTSRILIDETIVQCALDLASIAKDSRKIHDYADTQQRYLVLRQRGRRVGWFVRCKRRMKWIGNAKKEPGAPDFLDLGKARRKAGEQYYTMKPSSALKLSGEPLWTWADLDREYRSHLGQRHQVGQRIKPPSQATQDDVRLCFDKPEFASWQKLKLTELSPMHLIKLLKDIHAARGHRAVEKAAAYVKAALSWALSQRSIESDLAGAMPWWPPIQPPQPTEDEIDVKLRRQQELLAAKEACTVEYLGEVLTKHEQYCAGRQANRRISPGVRWGVWWVALTASRRSAATKLRRVDLKEEDPLNPYASPNQPWGVAEWSAEAVKNKLPFMLPIPPFGLHIAKSCTWDCELLVCKKRGFRSLSQWVFASSRRPRPKDENSAIEDPSIYPNSLNAHVRALRGRKRSGSNKVDYLAKKPEFWPHLVRSAMTNYFAQHRATVPPAAASAMLGHTLPDDKELDWLQISKTTERYYLTYQHMDLKALAMKHWCAALLQAYVNTGGTLPMPYESKPFNEMEPSKRLGPDWALPKLPGEEPSHPRRRGDHPRRRAQRRARKHSHRRTRRRTAA